MPLSLNSIHARTIAKVNLDRDIAEKTAKYPDPPAVLDDKEGHFRLVEIADRTRPFRREWLSGVLRFHQSFSYGENTISHLLQAERRFSILLISGDDLRRVNQIVRETGRVLPSKQVVPVLSATSAETRTELLRRGVMDVLDCGMTQTEAIARLRSLVRRLHWANDRSAAELSNSLRRELKLGSLATGALSPMEKRILLVLADHENRSVTYRSLASQLTNRWDKATSPKSLHVCICHLRRKLRQGVRIENQWGKGYSLTRDVVHMTDQETSHA